MKIIYPLVIILLLMTAMAVASSLNIGIPLRVSTIAASSAELSVVGEGKMDVTPDVAHIDVGVTVNKVATPQEAQKSIAKTNSAIVAALKELGVDKADVKTTNYYVNPNYDYTNGANILAGYNGSAQLTIKVRAIDNVSAIIEAAMNAGANEVMNTRFSVDKPEVFREQARSKAIQNAKDQAQKIAKELGIKLGKVTNVIESSGGDSVIMGKMYAAEGLGGGGGADLQPGSQTITSTVTLYFEKR